MSTLAEMLDRLTTAGELYEREKDGAVRCVACAHRCLIRPGRRGICQVRFNDGGTLRVPSGVELRGCFDVPHHTVSAGSVLLTTHGAGNEKATPFLSLEPRSGLRGITVWHPEQKIGRASCRERV